ncbi:DUF4290 domain-containing protein [Halosquirtibacter xylanolyticus]|uniref:DUF4290 domain-containing protein n=1 Tax=Halosquirtibacter xylanolyticus TaxID=3374599 RepID=UPI00374A793D|nr:DUF4290 domain-containing protein [Prolixibacteraceae bacterium]
MEYNSSRKRLIMPEYGRNIQKMVDQLLDIQNKEHRNAAAQTIIDIMGNMYPYLRDVPDFKHKLWDHIAIMSNFTLDIDSPYPLPTKESLSEKPKKVPYPQKRIKKKHYGHLVDRMIEKALEFEDGHEKEELIKSIANHMKKSYFSWNKGVVNDEQIAADLKQMSNGKLILNDIKLSETRKFTNNSTTRRKSYHQDNKKQYKKSNHQGYKKQK